MNRRWIRGIRNLFVGLFFLGGCWAVGRWLDIGKDWLVAESAEAYQWGLSKVTREVVVEKFLDPQEADTEMLLEESAAKYGVPKVVLKAMALQESGRSWNKITRTRFEPALAARHEKDIPNSLTDEERRLFWASHGVLQVVYGFHYKTCGLKSWLDLHQFKTGIDCGAKILRNQLDRFSDIRNKKDRLFMALRGYNGDVNLPQTADYANTIIGNLTSLTIEDIKDGI